MDNHLHFEMRSVKGRKTPIYTVLNDIPVSLGEIRWWSGWRKYVWFQGEDVIMSHDCLQEVVDFIRKLMMERRFEQKEKREG